MPKVGPREGVPGQPAFSWVIAADRIMDELRLPIALDAKPAIRGDGKIIGHLGKLPDSTRSPRRGTGNWCRGD
jgi:hypothetical protein